MPPAIRNIDGSASSDSWVLRPEKVKKIGSSITTVTGSSTRRTSLANTPRGITVPSRNPPNTA